MISGFVCYPSLLGSFLYFDGQKYTSINRSCYKLKTQKKGKTFINPTRKEKPRKFAYSRHSPDKALETNYRTIRTA